MTADVPRFSLSESLLFGGLLSGVGLVLVALVLELFLRLWVSYSPGYYVGITDPGEGTLRYPYGYIPVNSHGFPDDDFREPKSKRRVAYLGDSVCFGVGAGYGYRITEVLDELSPNVEHMNFGRVARAGIDKRTEERLLPLLDELDVDAVVYLMNLNDILPSTGGSVGPRAEPHAQRNEVWRVVKHTLDRAFRGRSYLYTQIRYSMAVSLARVGIGHDGTREAEFFPTEETRAFQDTAQRIIAFDRALAERGRGFAVVILPYEMQISADAEAVYASHGVRWDHTFVDSGPQRKLAAMFDPSITVIDAMWAFLDPNDPEASRRSIKVGQFFVYNRGDKLDWNHPNRAGHRRIAEHLHRSGLFPLRPRSD